MRSWWQSLAAAPVPLSRGDKAALLVLSLLAAATRMLAVSKGLWDWDEALFTLAVRDYDVRLHHPHPPGFPLFVGMGKLLPLEPFQSLQLLVVISSLLVFPAAFFLARELRASTATALSSAVVLSFLPNVWLFGGTAFSDVPALVLAVAAAALVLRGCRSAPALVAGGILAGIGAGIRPQNVVFAAVPMLIAFSHRRRTAVVATVAAASIAALAFAGAAHWSGGWAAYRETLTRHAAYIEARDSFRSPVRPGLTAVFDDFFLRPFRAPVLNIVLAVLSASTLLGLRRRPHAFVAVATFAPFAIVAWLYLDFHSVSRFSIAYMPLLALLAADAPPPKLRVPSALVLAAALAWWAWPGVNVVRTTDSPPVAAANYIRSLDRERTLVYVDRGLVPHAELLLSGYQLQTAKSRRPATAMERARVVLYQEYAGARPGSVNFFREGTPLESIARRRYFEAAVVPVERISFGEGWFGEEGKTIAPFRWMSRRGTIHLPQRLKPYRLEARMVFPSDGVVLVRVDGRLVDRIEARRGPAARSWTIDRGWREMTLETDTVVHAPGDPRELGLRLDSLEIP